ncbi:MAG: M28 family peptidase [Candidatus Hydrogenedens sp.]|nr:M28 family peptidase [Candidatus Hydrogenedens sp.]
MDSLTRITEDINYLAGTTFTRRYGTEGELIASEYIRNRLLEMQILTKVEPFTCSRESYQIFSLYWIEFIFVFLLSFFIPMAGFIYGLLVIFLYFLELVGYFSLSQYLSEFQSQNIHGVIKTQHDFEEPKCRIVFHANYDCGVSHFLYSTSVVPFLPMIHNAVVISMLIIVGTSLINSLFGKGIEDNTIILLLEVGAVIFLATLGLITFISTSNQEDTRGANFNASGVASVLAIAEYFSKQPIENIELHFLFTGAHQCWMSGLRHFLKTNHISKTDSLIINIEGVGTGDLYVPLKEQTVFSFSVDKQLKEIIEKVGANYGVKTVEHLQIPTSSYITLAWGYKGFTIIGLDKEGNPVYLNRPEDTTLNIEEKQIDTSAKFACSFVRAWIGNNRF